MTTRLTDVLLVKNTIDIQVTADLLQIYEDHCKEIQYINTKDHQRGE